MGNKRNQRAGSWMERIGSSRKSRKLREVDGSDSDETYVQRQSSRLQTAYTRPLTRSAKKLVAEKVSENIPSFQPEPSQDVNQNRSGLSTIALVNQILCEKYTTAAASNNPMENSNSPSSFQAETPVTFGSISAPNASMEEEPVLTLTHEIPVGPISSSAAASTEELTPDPPVLILHEIRSCAMSPVSEDLVSEPPVHTTPSHQIPLLRSPVSNASTAELVPEPPLHTLTHQIPLSTISPSSNASTEELAPEPEIHAHGHDIPLCTISSDSDAPTENLESKPQVQSPANDQKDDPTDRGQPDDLVDQAPGPDCASHAADNTTRMVELMGDDSSNSNEAESGCHNPYIEIEGYVVKNEVGDILKSIIVKYGDIAKRSPYSLQTRASFLENVCSIYQKLDASKIEELRTKQLLDMIEQVEDFEKLKLEVGWLRMRLEEIREAKELSNVKQEKTRNKHVLERSKEELERCGKELAIKKDEFKKLKNEVAATIAEKNGIEEKLVRTKAKFRHFLGRSLAHGLL